MSSRVSFPAPGRSGQDPIDDAFYVFLIGQVSEMTSAIHAVRVTASVGLFVVACGILIACPSVYGAPAPVATANAGFENPSLGEGFWAAGDPPGWTWVGDAVVGVWNAPDFEYSSVVPEGNNVAYTERYGVTNTVNGLAQVLGETFAANTDYTLTVGVGNSEWSYWWSGYSVQLLAGGTVIAEDNDTLRPGYGQWATSTVPYTYDSGENHL